MNMISYDSEFIQRKIILGLFEYISGDGIDFHAFFCAKVARNNKLIAELENIFKENGKNNPRKDMSNPFYMRLFAQFVKIDGDGNTKDLYDAAHSLSNVLYQLGERGLVEGYIDTVFKIKEKEKVYRFKFNIFLGLDSFELISHIKNENKGIDIPDISFESLKSPILKLTSDGFNLALHFLDYEKTKQKDKQQDFINKWLIRGTLSTAVATFFIAFLTWWIA